MKTPETLSPLSKVGLLVFGVTSVVAAVDKYIDPLDRWSAPAAETTSGSEVSSISLTTTMEEDAPVEHIGDGVYLTLVMAGAALTLAGAREPNRRIFPKQVKVY